MAKNLRLQHPYVGRFVSKLSLVTSESCWRGELATAARMDSDGDHHLACSLSRWRTESRWVEPVAGSSRDRLTCSVKHTSVAADEASIQRCGPRKWCPKRADYRRRQQRRVGCPLPVVDRFKPTAVVTEATPTAAG